MVDKRSRSILWNEVTAGPDKPHPLPAYEDGPESLPPVSSHLANLGPIGPPSRYYVVCVTTKILCQLHPSPDVISYKVMSTYVISDVFMKFESLFSSVHNYVDIFMMCYSSCSRILYNGECFRPEFLISCIRM